MTSTSKPKDSNEIESVWHALFTGQHPKVVRHRRFFRTIAPFAVDRCRMCLVPFEGIIAPFARVMGRGRWHRDAHVCEQCETFLRENRGGTELELAVLFADVRGSTPMANKMRPMEFGQLMQRFFTAATKEFYKTDAMIDKMVGDEVIGIFLPAFTHVDYRANAVRAGLDLLYATGHGDRDGPWLSIGVAVHAGTTFIGSLGVEGGAYEFAALGDTMNLCARLVGAANPGELVISDTIWPVVAADFSGERRSFSLKGYDQPVSAHVVRLSH